MFKTPKNLTLKETNKERIRPKSFLKNNLTNFSNNNLLSPLTSLSNENGKNKKIYKIKTHFHNVDKEQLYENNVQLKQYINKLEKELMILKLKLNQREKEIKNKDNIIYKYINSNNLINREKLVESNLISHYKARFWVSPRAKFAMVMNTLLCRTGRNIAQCQKIPNYSLCCVVSGTRRIVLSLHIIAQHAQNL